MIDFFDSRFSIKVQMTFYCMVSNKQLGKRIEILGKELKNLKADLLNEIVFKNKVFLYMK